MVEQLALRYRAWLLTCYTQRYQAISTQVELDWFERVTQLVVVRKIMERKYEAFLYEQRESFADPWVAEEMTVLMRLNTLAGEIARTIYSTARQPIAAQRLVEQLYEMHAAYLEKRSQKGRTPLPPLLPATPMPLAFLPGKNGDRVNE